ncbi:NmrA family NAD(P)-binding protein [Mycolicibacterium sp. CBMA 226]|uniref:NmrA family NAD(P)-binding protein n=1 Tax=Mycolicibacterium sp. CBMA 226 TaxID=2606611 RepID=UPI001412B700|nr:NmrA family NAD(P)-binding protein [Mycolicibacterium sp. CBMA 226]
MTGLLNDRKKMKMAQSNSTRYLIVGAGGSHGATGNHVARQLLARGLHVRAFVRKVDARAEQLKALGAELAVGDLHDFSDVQTALDGVQHAYFTYPLADGLLLATANFAVVGTRTGLQSIVNMSQITARPDHGSPAARQHWLAERVFDWSGIGVTHLRPPFFLENLFNVAAPTVGTEAKMYLPYGQGRHAPISGVDIARVAVGILTDPSPHHGKTYVPTGPAALTMTEQAGVFSRVLDRGVEYVDIPVERWRQILSTIPVMSPYLIEHLSHVAVSHQNGEFDVVTEVVETIGGTPPQSIEAFIRDHRTVFEPPRDAHLSA